MPHIRLLRTIPSLAPTFLRLILGVIFIAHGSQKVLGAFGGAGFTATMRSFEDGMHIPAVFAFLSIVAEFFGGIGLVVGFLTRIAAFGIFCDMIVAAAIVHWKNGLFMNWSGRQPGEGIEYHLLAIGVCIALMILGAGLLSIDRAIAHRNEYRAR